MWASEHDEAYSVGKETIPQIRVESYPRYITDPSVLTAIVQACRRSACEETPVPGIYRDGRKPSGNIAIIDPDGRSVALETYTAIQTIWVSSLEKQDALSAEERPGTRGRSKISDGPTFALFD